MSTYAIGDIQGCLASLQRLLDKIRFDPARDRLWFCGDLVNRGPDSLGVLRFIRNLGDRAVTVLGNHDLHLLAVAHGLRKIHRKDTLAAVLDAADRDELLDWLRHQPLMHHDALLTYTMVHAGLPPQWDLDKALACAGEVQQVLRGDDLHDFLSHMYGDEPEVWSEELTGWDRLRFITNCFTRLRYCDAEGHLHLASKGAPGSQPAPFVPWFEIPERASRDLRVVFGHWSTLGKVEYPGVFALDTGCIWGGALTALRLEGEPSYTRIDCEEVCKPGVL